MNLTIREVIAEDIPFIQKLNDLAFRSTQEGQLVVALFDSEAYIPSLSLVLCKDSQIIGHILFSRATIKGSNIPCDTLTLAPMCIHPDYQKKGFGSRLVKEGLHRAKQSGFSSVIVLGHPAYYPRFGFKPASQRHIKSPWPVPDEAFMALELVDGAFSGVEGVLNYAAPFYAM